MVDTSNTNIASQANSRLGIDSFVDAARQAPDKGGALQLSKDGKLHVTVGGKGIEATITKLTHTLYNLFGLDLRDKYGVPPNEQREQAAHTAFREVLSDAKTPGADLILKRDDLRLSTHKITASQVREFASSEINRGGKPGGKFAKQYNGEIAQKFMLSDDKGKSQQGFLTCRDAGFNSKQIESPAFRSAFNLLLEQNSSSGYDFLNEDKLGDKLHSVLEENKAILQEIADPSAESLRESLEVEIPRALESLFKNVEESNAQGITKDLLVLCKERKKMETMADEKKIPGGGKKLFNLGVAKTASDLKAVQDGPEKMDAFTKNIASEEDSQGIVFREVLGAFKAASLAGEVDVGEGGKVALRNSANDLVAKDLSPDFVAGLPSALGSVFASGEIAINALSLMNEVTPNQMPKVSGELAAVEARASAISEINGDATNAPPAATSFIEA